MELEVDPLVNISVNISSSMFLLQFKNYLDKF